MRKMSNNSLGALGVELSPRACKVLTLKQLMSPVPDLLTGVGAHRGKIAGCPVGWLIEK